MPNPYFRFKQFTVFHDRCAMKVTTDACLFGAWCAEEIKNEELKIKNCLDVGTGSGLLSLMIAQKNDVQIEAVEIDKNAAEQAKENVAQSPFKHVKIIHQDVLDYKPGKQFDVIVSNPPFYEHELLSVDEQKNMAHHSSRLKFEDLLSKIREMLNAEGAFFLLMPYKRKDDVESLLKRFNLTAHKFVFIKQTEKHEPFRMMIRGKNAVPVSIKEEELTIKEKDSYTGNFRRLLKDYYLYL